MNTFAGNAKIKVRSQRHESSPIHQQEPPAVAWTFLSATNSKRREELGDFGSSWDFQFCAQWSCQTPGPVDTCWFRPGIRGDPSSSVPVPRSNWYESKSDKNHKPSESESVNDLGYKTTWLRSAKKQNWPCNSSSQWVALQRDQERWYRHEIWKSLRQE